MIRFLTVLIAAICFATIAPAQTITVSGRGEVQVAPDMARIQIGVTKEAKSADQAMADLSSELAMVLDALDAAGLSSEAVQTSSVRLNLRQDYNASGGAPRITGYIASSDIRVEVFDLEMLGELMDAVVSAGANQINSLQFDVADGAPHLEDTRRAAVVNGAEKANVFAQAAGLTLGTLQELTEGGAVASPMRMEASLARDAGVPIAPGQITFSATVTMRYVAE